MTSSLRIALPTLAALTLLASCKTPQGTTTDNKTTFALDTGRDDPTTDTDTDTNTDTDTDTVTTPTGTTTLTGDTSSTTPTGDTGSSTTGITTSALRLATWNVSRLDLEGQGDNPRTADDLALLGTYVDRLEADVVALQEVRAVAGTQTIFPGSDWSAECENRNSSQNVCVVLRTASGWTMTRNPDVTALNDSDPNLRQGLDITLSRPDHAPLRILAVHLKFGCFVGESYPDCSVYFDQIAVVEAWIDARATAGEAYAVLGDFNRFMTATDTAWLELDDSIPAGADLTRSIPQGTPTPCWSDVFTEFIDHIMLDPTSTSWMEASDQLVYDETDFDAYYERLSDHCPVWADFQIPQQ